MSTPRNPTQYARCSGLRSGGPPQPLQQTVNHEDSDTDSGESSHTDSEVYSLHLSDVSFSSIESLAVVEGFSEEEMSTRINMPDFHGHPGHRVEDWFKDYDAYSKLMNYDR